MMVWAVRLETAKTNREIKKYFSNFIYGRNSIVQDKN
jgi:hypothetical protein